MPGGKDPVGGGVRDTYDGRGPLVPEVTEGKGSLKGVLGGDGACVAGGVH